MPRSLKPKLRTLVIPDIHNKVLLAQRIIDFEKADRVVFLGDFFDDFGDTPGIARETAIMVKYWLHQPNMTLLLGNHDQSYGWGWANHKHLCSGWTTQKALQISEVLVWTDWLKFKLHTWVDGWLLTHAGWNEHWGKTKAVVNKRLKETLESLHDQTKMGDGEDYKLRPLLAPSQSRGGANVIGGVTWEDFRDLMSPKGFKQLCGHTIGNHVRQNGNAVCLDTHLKHYAILQDGTLDIREVKLPTQAGSSN